MFKRVRETYLILHMRKFFLVGFFSLIFAYVLSPFGVCASSEPVTSAEPEGVPVAAPAAPEKLFYKIALNESFFIREREAVVNARATVDILQGEMDKVTLEVFGIGNGQGEIFNVSGEKVKDWSIRREGSRTFLEIRPKDLGAEKQFTLTISGRQPLKLPTTISPLIFSGVDSAAFVGVVQFLASTDLRLYAKQERGLIPLGERTRSQINYSILGTPSLRLDIARANELLAPVSLEKFSLSGDVGASGARFRLRAKALVREIGAEVPVLTGNAALLDFPEKNDFVVLAKTDKKSGESEYLLRFPARGEFDVDLLFDAGIREIDGWRQINFCVPVAQVAPYSLKGMPSDTVFATDNVSIPQMNRERIFEGFLPSSGALDLRWRPSIPTPPEFSAAVYAIDSVSEMQITTGVLRQKSELNFTISQGELSSLFFEMAGTGDVLSVSGQDLLSWTLIPLENGKRGLSVRLSQPKSENYKLRVISQTRAIECPATLEPIRLVPARKDWEGLPLASVCVRNNEVLRLRNGIGIRCEALPHAGMTQIVASEFPADGSFFKKDVSEDEASVYRLSSEIEKLRVKADFIHSDLIVTPRERWFFDEGKISSGQLVSFEVHDAPLYEMHVLVPDDLSLVSLDSEIVASHELLENPETPGYRLLKVVFSEPLLGEGKFALAFQKEVGALGQTAELRSCLFPQAHFVSGEIGVSARKQIRLLPEAEENLAEISPAEFSEKNPPEMAFRRREGKTSLRICPVARPADLRGVSSCVYKIGRDKIFGNLKVDYTPGSVPVSEVEIAFPAGAKVLSVSGEAVRNWTVDERGVAKVQLSGGLSDAFSVSASFEGGREDGVLQPFEGATLNNVVSDSGTILITADRVLSLAGEESVHALSTLPLKDADPDYVRRGGAILFRAYQFVERPFRLQLETRLPKQEATPKVIVTEAQITSNAGQSCDIVYRCNSLGASELNIGVPEGMKIVCAGAKNLPDGTLALPIPPKTGEISLRMEPVNGEEDFARERRLEFPKVFAPVMRTVFVGFGVVSSSTMGEAVSGRVLNDVPDAAFWSRLLDCLLTRFYVPALAFLGLVIALSVSGFISSRRKTHRVLRVVALAAGTVFSVACVWRLVETVCPEYGEAVYIAGLTEPGAVLEVTLHRFYFLNGGLPLGLTEVVLVCLFVFGVSFLLCGSVCRRLCLRIAGRSLVYISAAIFALEDFPYRVPAFVAATVFVEIFALLAPAVVRGISRISVAHVGRAGLWILAAAGLALAFPPDARGEASGAAVEIPALAEEIEILHDVADRITQAIDVRGDRIVARGDIRVTGYAGDRFDLLASPAVLTSFEKAEKSMLRLERIRSKDSGYVYQVVLERAGTFSAKFSYELALKENARGFPILSGSAAADVATVHVPRAEVQVSAKGAVTTTLTPWGEKSQIAQIVFKPKAEREVFWNPRERERSREALRVFASGENLYVPSAGVIEGRHVMKFVPAQGEISRVRIRIPAPFSVSRIEGAAIHRWNFNRETGLLTVLFTAPRISDFSLSIFTQTQLSFLPVRKKFSALEALDCDVQVSTIGIATGEALQVDAVYVGNLATIDEDEFTRSFAAAGMAIDPGLRLRRAFRSVDKAGEFEAELSAVSPNLRITGEEKFFVNSDSVRAEVKLTATVSRAEVFNLEYRIPAGINVDVIRGEMLNYWEKIPLEDGSSRIVIRLKQALSGEQEFRIWLSGAFPQDAKEWALPNFWVENAKSQRGEITVSVDEGLRLVPVASGRTMFKEASEDGESDTFRFRYYSRGSEAAKFQVVESKPFTNVSWLHRVSPSGRYAHSNWDMIFEIENVARDSVCVRIPDNALAVRFFGKDLISTAKTEDNPSVYELRFSKPIRGNVRLSAEFFTPLPLTNVVRIPRVFVADAERQNAWLAVENGNVFTELKSHSPEKVAEADVPAELRPFLDGKSWMLEKYAEKYPAESAISADAVRSWNESRSDVHRDSFRAESLRRYTVYNRENAITEEQISLNVTRSDVLRILLPKGGTLRSVSVAGSAARVVPLGGDGENSVWLPIFAKEAVPVEISVVYEHAPVPVQRGERRVWELVPAEIVGAEKETWSLCARDESAEILEIFGRTPETLPDVAPDENSRFLESYFKDGSVKTYVADGNDISKFRAVLSFPQREKAGNGNGLEVFLFLFSLVAVFKIFRFWKKQSRK